MVYYLFVMKNGKIIFGQNFGIPAIVGEARRYASKA